MNGDGKKAYPSLERLSLAELEELLSAEAYASERLDMEYVKAILEVMDRKEKDGIDIDEYIDADEMWQAILENVANSETERTAAGLNEPSPTPKVPKKTFRIKHKIRVAVIAAAIIVVMAALLVANAFGFNVIRAIAEWGEDIFQFRLSSKPAVSDEQVLASNYQPLQDALDENGIYEEVAPKWFPDGIELTEVNVVVLSNRTIIDAAYNNETQYFTIVITSYHEIPEELSSQYEKDSSWVTKYTKGGIKHYIMSNNDNSRAAWINNNLECKIHGNLGEQDLKRMINSIYER